MSILLLAATLAAPTPLSVIAALPPCAANQILLRFDTEDGAFDGMSHSGALMIVRNLGPAACKLEGLPKLEFRDAAGRPVALVRRAPAGMHPGPVVLPVGLAPGAEATSPLLWVSGAAFPGHNCVEPIVAETRVGSGMVRQPFVIHACGAPGAPVSFEQPPLRTDAHLAP